MGYIFKKVITREFEIDVVKRNFMKYKKFHNVRKDVPNCEFCNKEFSLEDNTNLAFIPKKQNILICDACAEEIVKGGAREASW